jgi:hypothetical protein
MPHLSRDENQHSDGQFSESLQYRYTNIFKEKNLHAEFGEFPQPGQPERYGLAPTSEF